MRHLFAVDVGVQVGQVEVVPEHGAVPAVVEQRGRDVLSLLQSKVQALPLHTKRKHK